MKVELLKDWMGHPKGSELNLSDTFARTLISRDAAKEVREEAKKPAQETKQQTEPPKNKEITSPPSQKDSTKPSSLKRRQS